MLLASGSGTTDDVHMDLSKYAGYNIRYPKNSCDSRAPLDLPRPRGGSTPAPQQPSEAPAKERAPMTDSASGGRREPLPGTDRSLPGMADNSYKMELPALYRCTNACAAVHPSPARHRNKLCTNACTPV